MANPGGRAGAFELSGYEVQGTIGSGAHSVVYRARRDQVAYAVKVLKAAGADAAEAGARFRQEAAALARLSHPGLVKVIETGLTDGNPYMVMELVEGETLTSVLKRERRLSEAQAVALARHLAAALAEVHRRGLVHRDLKPSNIVVPPGTEAKIIDFGLVGKVRTGEGEAPDEVVGTFLYVAPEQSGMLRRPVDGRSDLYALGVVLFECLTGCLPFKAETVAELLKQHAAVRPPEVAGLNPEVGPVTSAIVAKLLSKDPDDRYQSARGLLADLERLPELQRAEKLVLGTHDSATRLAAEFALVGRRDEQTRLEQAWLRAAGGSGALVQIEGEPGMGKTRLARELLLKVGGKALVLIGKAQKQETTPLGPFRAAIDGYLARVRRMPEQERTAHLERLKRAAGTTAGIVRRLTPALTGLLADAPEIPPLDPAEEDQRRFYGRVADFFVELARGHGGLLLVIDDVQWADAGSIEILSRLAESVPNSPVLALTAARNDPESEAARSRFVERIGPRRIERIVLGRLMPDEEDALIRAHLGDRELEEQVCDRLRARSGGNPFALGEYVRCLLDQGLLRPTAAGWVADADRFGATELPNDVISVLVGRAATLGSEVQGVLATAAVAGFAFDAATVAAALGRDVDRVAPCLEEALRANLVERLGPDRHQFVHDRVPEALVAGLSDTELRDLHQALAGAVESVWEESTEKTLSLARHYALGHADRHRQRVFETSLAAGTVALEAHSNQLAFESLERARDAAGELGVPREQLSDLETLLGAACTRTGRAERSFLHFERALELASSAEQKARIHSLRADSHTTQARNDAAWEDLQQALRLLGVWFPKNRAMKLLLLLFLWVSALFRIWTRLGFGSARKKGGLARSLEVARILTKSGPVVFFLDEPLALPIVAVRMLHHTHFLGTHPLTAIAQTYFGTGLAFSTGKRSPYLKYCERGVAMAHQLGAPEAIASCEMFHAGAVIFLKDPVQGVQLLERAVTRARLFCRNFEYMMFSGLVAGTPMLLGRPRKAVELWDDCIRHTRSIDAQTHTSDWVLWRQLCLAFGDSGAERAEVDRAIADLDRATSSYFRSLVPGLQVAMKVAHLDPDDDLDEAYSRYLDLCVDDPVTRVIHVLMGYCQVERLHAASTAERPARRAALERQLRRLLRAPIRAHCFTVYQPHVLLFRAVLAAERGQERRAMNLLAEAETVAGEIGSVWGELAVRLERARRLVRRRDRAGANAEARRALESAREHGWTARARRVRDEFGLEKESQEMLEPHPPESPRTATAAALTTQRHVDALLQVALASASSLEPEEQCRNALDRLVQVLGAERAFLFLTGAEGDGLQMQAGRDSEGHDLLPLTGYSSTVVRRVHETGEPLVVTGTEEGEALGSESAAAHDLRSIMAVPLRFRDRMLGVVYADSRLARGLFSREHVQILQAISNHIAIAIETARLARRRNEELQREVDRRTAELRELNARLQQEVVEQAASLQRARSLGRYLPPDVVRAVMEEGAKVEATQSRQQLTVFRLGLKGFDAVVAAVEPEEMAAMLNSYLSAVTDLAFEHGATVVRLEQDEVVGFFGAPRSEGAEQDARRCIAMARAVWQRAREVCGRWRDLLSCPVPAATMVIASGHATVGNFGSSARLEYTALGGPMAETRALMGRVPPGEVVCTGTTRALAADLLEERTRIGGLYRIAQPPDRSDFVAAAPARGGEGTFDLGPNKAEVAGTPRPGTVIAGRYEVVRELGAGGMGTVLQVEDRKLEQQVALKLLQAELHGDAECLARLRREVKLARLVSHENVARIFDLGEWAGYEFITMEYLEGCTLEQELRTHRPLPLERGLAVVRGLCAGLAAAHAAGVIHRDLKPQNIMLEPSGRVVILDFGIARPQVGQEPALTERDRALGTPRYMAPEQLECRGVDARTDIYALGLVSFELFTGKGPFEADSTLGAAVRRLQQDPPDPLALRPDLPPRLGAVILRCLQRAPADRFASAGEVASLLAAI